MEGFLMNIRFILASIFCVNVIVSNLLPVKKQQECLCKAIKNNSGEEVLNTIMASVKKGHEGSLPECILLKAIMTGSSEEIKQAVQPVLNEGKNNISPINRAVLLKRSSPVKTLLECGAKVDPSTIDMAIKMGDISTILLLIKKGTNVSCFEDDLINVIVNQGFFRSEAKALEAIQILINQGYDVNKIWGIWFFQTNGNWNSFLDLLFKNGANPNCIFSKENPVTKQKVFNHTPLSKAIFYDNDKVVKILLEAGADSNQKVSGFGQSSSCGPNTFEPHSPLYFAINSGRANKAKIIELLLDYGATIN